LAVEDAGDDGVAAHRARGISEYERTVAIGCANQVAAAEVDARAQVVVERARFLAPDQRRRVGRADELGFTRDVTRERTAVLAGVVRVALAAIVVKSGTNQ
jgi:hypothetical protein